MARVLPRSRAEKYATLLEPLEEPFQEASDSNSRVSGWEKQSSDNQCRCHAWICSTILLGGLQRKGNLLSESRSRWIQGASSWKTSWTSFETVCFQHQWSASVYSSTENENIKWSWEGVEQAAQIDSDLSLWRHPSNIQCTAHREHLSTALETVEDDPPAERGRQQFSRWIKHDRSPFCRVLAKSTNDASSSIFANGWKTMLFYHQNNRVFASTTQRQRDSCSFCNTSALASYNKPASLVIYIDFTKAFDQLWHDGLLYKLHRMNCPHEIVIFIIEYLKNRKCYIETQKHMCRIEFISSLVLRNGSTNYFSHLFSSICGWPCTDHPCLSMVASNWIRTPNATNRPASIETSPSLRHRVETADQLP